MLCQDEATAKERRYLRISIRVRFSASDYDPAASPRSLARSGMSPSLLRDVDSRTLLLLYLDSLEYAFFEVCKPEGTRQLDAFLLKHM